jgi:hypothetical protein
MDENEIEFIRANPYILTEHAPSTHPQMPSNGTLSASPRRSSANAIPIAAGTESSQSYTREQP